jgi:hypothetical protein
MPMEGFVSLRRTNPARGVSRVPLHRRNEHLHLAQGEAAEQRQDKRDSLVAVAMPHHVTMPLARRAAAVVLTLAGTVLIALAWGTSGEPPTGETLAVALSGLAGLALGAWLWFTKRADDVGGWIWWAVAVVAGAFLVLAFSGVAPGWLAGAGIAALLFGSVAWRA